MGQMKIGKPMKANVFDDARRMKKEMDDSLNEVFDKRGLFPAEKNAKKPLSEISVKDGNVIAAIELPGMERKDIQVEISEKHIEVMAVRKNEIEIKNNNRYQRSFNASKFYRLFPLPAKVDAEKANAEFKNGVLRITAPIIAASIQAGNKQLERSKVKKLVIN